MVRAVSNKKPKPVRGIEVVANRGAAKDAIVQALENDILSGRLAPGSAIDERSLSLRFAVSRTPVREAIGRLQAQGLVEVRPRSGSFVSRITLTEVLQLFELMGELEALCAKYAAARMSTELRQELRRLATGCRNKATGSRDEYAKANTAFHDLVYVGSGNPPLEQVTRSTRLRVAAYRRYTLEIPGRLKKSSDEHDRIVEFIERGDGEGAYRAMRDHIDIRHEDYAPFIAIFERAV